MDKLTFKNLVINPDEKLCYIDDVAIKLTKSEYNILLFLMNHRNKIFTREELIKVAWKKSVSIRAVDTAMFRIRNKLKEYGKYIVSRIGFGYGFIEKME